MAARAIATCGLDSEKLLSMLMPTYADTRTRRPYASADPAQQKAEQRERNRDASERNRRRWEVYDANLLEATHQLRQLLQERRTLLSFVQAPPSPESAITLSDDEVEGCATNQAPVGPVPSGGVESAVLVILLCPLLMMLYSPALSRGATSLSTTTAALSGTCRRRCAASPWMPGEKSLCVPQFRSPASTA